MYKNFDPHTPYFYSVSLMFILSGALLLGISIMEAVLNEFSSGFSFNNVFAKLAAGLVVMALGYIHLELELVRISRKH